MMEVLQTKDQITRARKEMVRRKVSHLEPRLIARTKRILARLGIHAGPSVGDFIKSWDVLETINFLEEKILKSDPVLDIGAYASELVVALHKNGFTELSAIDLNNRIHSMPYAEQIHYNIGDFTNTNMPTSSFKAITSISVIEHGYDPQKLLEEASRLLMPGGFFVASFDYWPEKIDTTGVRFFDMDWLIFSKEDVSHLLEIASKLNLFPVGDLKFSGTDRAVEHGGYEYTFGWLALKKSA